MKVTQTLSSFTNITEKPDFESNNATQSKPRRETTNTTGTDQLD